MTEYINPELDASNISCPNCHQRNYDNKILNVGIIWESDKQPMVNIECDLCHHEFKRVMTGKFRYETKIEKTFVLE